MPVCRLIPGFDDQCENFEGYWDDLDQASKATCKQQHPNCGPIIDPVQLAALIERERQLLNALLAAQAAARNNGQAGGRKRRRGTKKSKRTRRSRRRTTRKH